MGFFGQKHGPSAEGVGFFHSPSGASTESPGFFLGSAGRDLGRGLQWVEAHL